MAERASAACSESRPDPGSLPDSFLSWLAQSRMAVFEHLLRHGAEGAREHPGHLPVLATMGDGPFPINLACKGMGPLPRPELLDQVSAEFEAARHSDPSLVRRIATARAFYADWHNFDPSCLGGLEIFEGRTFANLRALPRASLLFFSGPPEFRSTQLNGSVELCAAGDSRFRFLLAARQLFSHDAFHIPQSRYAAGYLLRPVEVITKTPYPRG